MLKVSLSNAIGKEKSRQVKKALLYSFGAGAAYTVVAWVWLAYSIACWLERANPLNAPDWVYFCLLYLPVILWAGIRVWYKYAHNKEEALENRTLANSFLDIALGRKEFMEEMQSNIIKDSGNYRNDEAGQFTVQDLERAMKDGIELEDFETKGA